MSWHACSIHRPLKPNGDPQARGIIAATNGVTSKPGDIINDVIEAVAKAGDNCEECQNTEQMLNQIEDACNNTIKETLEDNIGEEEENELMTMSLDAKKLYNNLEVNATAKEIANEVLEKDITF